MSKALPLLACVLTLSLAAGCGNACLSLADAICSCQPDDNSRAVCNAQAKAQGNVFPVSKDDENVCQEKLDAHLCDCNKLTTAEGRDKCGLVITSPAP